VTLTMPIFSPAEKEFAWQQTQSRRVSLRRRGRAGSHGAAGGQMRRSHCVMRAADSRGALAMAIGDCIGVESANASADDGPSGDESAGHLNLCLKINALFYF
jgi:hypothetical protein